MGVESEYKWLCHMTGWPPCPCVANSFENLLLWNQKADDFETWLLEYYQVCSNDDRGLTLTYVTARSNLVTFVFVWENA